MSLLRALPLVALLPFSATAQATAEPAVEERSDPKGPFFGVGAALLLQPIELAGNESQFFVQQVGTSAILLPIHVEELRLEPEISFTRYRSPVPFVGDFGAVGARVSLLRLGIGAAYQWDLVEDTRAYAGARFGLQLASTKLDQFGEELTFDRTDLFFGFALGGEAFLTERFSLGVEARIEYLDYGDTTLEALQEELDDMEDGPNRYQVQTTGLVAARIYLF